MGFFNKLKHFVSLQGIYMPAAIKARDTEEEHRDHEDILPPAEHIKLYLPSELSCEDHQMGCTKRISEMEVHMQEAQCRQSLLDLYQKLHTPHEGQKKMEGKGVVIIIEKDTILTPLVGHTR